MNDQSRPSPADRSSDPFPPLPAVDPTEPVPGQADGSVRFTGRTRPNSGAIRAGIALGTGLLVVIGAAVAMGASPAPGTSGGANPAASSEPTPDKPDNGRGFGAFGFGGPGNPGSGWALGGPGRRDGRGFGQISVTAIAGSNLSLRTDDGWTRTITVGSSTKITKGGQAATLADIAVDDVIRFGESRNADGSYTITAIDIVVPQVAGTVTAVGSDTITIKGRDGSPTIIHTSGSTTYHVGKADGARSDVVVGSTIIASGKKATDGSIQASSVTVFLPKVAGVVTAKTADTITIKGRNGTTQTIHVGSGTTYEVAGKTGAGLADVTVGMGIIVEGTRRSDASIDASAVHAGSLRGLRGGDKSGDDHDAPAAPAAPGASGGTSG